MRNITHPQAPNHKSNEASAQPNNAGFAARNLAVFARNCHPFAERVAVGQFRLIDAADMLQGAAEISGLCETVGDEVIQRVMADTFIARISRVSK
jgi:hypothetical protein